MTLFSRFFRKAPPAPVPETVPVVAPAVPDSAAIEAKLRDEEAALRQATEARDLAAVGRLSITGSSTRIRQQAAEAIDDPTQIRELIKEVRGKDKNVYKIFKQKMDAVLARERAEAQAREEVLQLCSAIERHSRLPYDALFLPTLDHLEGKWQVLGDRASADMRERVQLAIDRCRALISQHVQKMASEAAQQAAMASAAAEAQRFREAEEAAEAERRAAVEAEEKERAEKAEAEALALRQLSGLLRKALGALSDGSTKRATGLRRAIEEKLSGIPVVPSSVSRQLQQLDEKLGELQDWKDYAVAPKRTELIVQMEALVGAETEPRELAGRIKRLQDQWRTISKGGGQDSESDWERFHQAAQAAYQPCREYFEAQAKLREENLQKKKALLARLSAFESSTNWEQPDWRTVATAIRESQQEWHRHSPTERDATKPVRAEFDAVLQRLQQRLDAEYAKNIEDKKSLISRAQRLSESEDSRKATDEVKRLQMMWKNIGPTPREEDRRLWEEFRQHCDAVFQRRQQEHVQHTAELEDNKAKATLLCEQMETIAALSGAALLEEAKKVPQVRSEFSALGEFPKTAARELHNRFERAVRDCEASVANQRNKDRQQSWLDLLESANLVNAYRRSVAENTPDDLRTQLKQRAETYIDGVRHWPKGGLQAIRDALAKEEMPDLEANEAALRMLCIRAEILADRPTPPEDQALRRDYQVKRLIQGMGQGSASDPEQLDAMILESIGIGPARADVHAELTERLLRCRAAQ